MTRIKTRAAALAVCSALILSGAAVWRAACPPRLVLTNETGDRSALAAFPLAGSCKLRADSFDDLTLSDFTLDETGLTTRSHVAVGLKEWNDPTLALSVRGKIEAFSAGTSIYLKPDGDGCAPLFQVHAAVPMEPGVKQTLLGPVNWIGISQSLEHRMRSSIYAETMLPLRADGAADESASDFGGSATQPAPDARTEFSRIEHDPELTLTSAMAAVDGTLFVAVGPHDDDKADLWTGETAVYRFDFPADAPVYESEGALTQIASFPAAGRGLLGLLPWDGNLLMVTREADSVILTLLGTSGTPLTTQTLPVPGCRTDLSFAADGGTAVLRLFAADAPEGPANYAPYFVTLRRAEIGFTVSAPWTADGMDGALLGAELTVRGETLVLRSANVKNDFSASLNVPRTTDPLTLNPYQYRAGIAVIDLSTQTPVYRAELLNPIHTQLQPVWPQQQEDVRIEWKEGTS